jgi:hypothetical protein
MSPIGNQSPEKRVQVRHNCVAKPRVIVQTKSRDPTAKVAFLLPSGFGLRFSDENSRGHKTLAEESTLGYLTRLASACHGRTVVTCFFQRFNNIAKGDQ